MEPKREIFITKETQNFLCRTCKREVLVLQGKPWVIETDKTIIHTWDYGHQHNRIFSVGGNQSEQVLLEETEL